MPLRLPYWRGVCLAGRRTSKLGRGLFPIAERDAAGAAKSLRRITSFDPQNAAAWRALGTADMELKHLNAAIADYRQAPPLVTSEITSSGANNSYETYDTLGRQLFVAFTAKF